MEELILNRYKAIDVAGRGGFGTVIVAWDTRMRRKVAIKQIPLAQKTQTFNQTVKNSTATQILDNVDANKTQVIEKETNNNNPKSIDNTGEHWQENIPGLSEARTAAMIQDANIVTVHDFELEGNNAYIIMEYVEGITLTQFLNNYSNQMTLDMLTCIFNGVAHALEVAHLENVLHLDIKPDNVLIDKKGKVKVTDFGLATLADEFGYGTADAGTLGYMPVEQMRKQALDVRCDQWALACLTYEMLSGDNPFDANDLRSAISKIEDAKLRPASSYWEDLDPELDNILFKALSPDVNDRFLSIKDFRQTISKFLSNAKAGQRQLSLLLKDSQDEDKEFLDQKDKFHFVDKLTGNLGRNIFARVFAVVLSVPLILTTCFNIEFFGWPELNIFGFIAIGVLFCITGFLPALGITVTCIGLSISLVLSGNYIIAGVLALISILWCVYSFKLSISNSNCVLSFSFFGSFGFAQFSPFINGLFNNIKNSIINCLFGFVICFILACFGSNTLIGWQPIDYAIFSSGVASYGNVQNNTIILATQISTWIWCFSWVICSVVISACFMLKQRSIHIIGTISGMVIMLVGICLANYFSAAHFTWQPQGWEILPTVLAGVSAIILASFLPNRKED